MQDFNTTLDLVLKILGIIALILAIVVLVYLAYVANRLNETVDRVMQVLSRAQNTVSAVPQLVGNTAALGVVRMALEVIKHRIR